MLYNYNVQSIKMENSPKSGFPWNFTTVLTKDGYRYVKAYRMKWDPVLKKSKRCLQRHVGRLFEDGRIKISPKFSADFPEYAGDDWFWGIDKKPVPEAQYRQDFPETPGPAPEDEEACQQQETLDVGLNVGGKERHPCTPSRGFREGNGRRAALFGNLQARRRRIHDDIRFVASESLAA